MAIARDVVWGGRIHKGKERERCLPCGPRQTRRDEHVRVGLPRASGRPYGCSPHVGSIQGCARRGSWGIARSSVRRGAQAWRWRFRSAHTAPNGFSGDDCRGGGGNEWRREASWCGGRGWVVWTARWCWQGVVREDVTDAGAAAAPVPSELSEWSPRPARCSHVLQGHPPLG